MSKVVNMNRHKYDVYIGRGSIFGNPYEVGVDGDRDEVLDKYTKWFNFLLRDPLFVTELKNLQGKTLGCFCKPDKCHGDIIVKYLDELQWEFFKD